MLGAVVGYTTGVAMGVAAVDNYDKPSTSLLGAIAGMGIGIVAADKYPNTLLVAPPVLAALMSEFTRDEPVSIQVGMNLGSGAIIARTTFRF